MSQLTGNDKQAIRDMRVEEFWYTAWRVAVLVAFFAWIFCVGGTQ